ncbi:ABC transporter substrate-binding protein [Mesorhizobium sp. RP14(2022)]|uniref:ABC transporter substrate-binding protein n=1 Tax=Mesorhizobium liriopis TaxID=2953882 RepID=A0ABT1C3F9_9HYPH|nr:ABC transporter substrate-binding protein [Mesorhizobium liriopis]MCO6049327.1 ABC transporter substrate-binding protein [Mesorhizobium liriopis]
MYSSRGFRRGLAIGLVGAAISSVAAAQEQKTISMIYFNGSSEALEVGILMDEGIFEKNGLKPEFAQATSGPAITSALASGSVQFGPGYPALYLPALKQNRALRVAGPFAESGFYNIIAQKEIELADPGVGVNENSLENVKSMMGKTVGVTALGAQTQVFVQLLAQQGGLDYKEITFVPTGGAASALAAFKNKQVDFLVTWIPEDGLLAEQGIEYQTAVNANSGPDNSFGLINGLWLVNSDFADENPDIAHAFCKATIELRQFVQDPQNKERVLEIMQKHQGLDRKGAEIVYENWRYVYEPIEVNYVSENLWREQSRYLTGTKDEGYVPEYGNYISNDCMKLGQQAMKQ